MTGIEDLNPRILALVGICRFEVENPLTFSELAELLETDRETVAQCQNFIMGAAQEEHNKELRPDTLKVARRMIEVATDRILESYEPPQETCFGDEKANAFRDKDGSWWVHNPLWRETKPCECAACRAKREVSQSQTA